MKTDTKVIIMNIIADCIFDHRVSECPHCEHEIEMPNMGPECPYCEQEIETPDMDFEEDLIARLENYCDPNLWTGGKQ